MTVRRIRPYNTTSMNPFRGAQQLARAIRLGNQIARLSKRRRTNTDVGGGDEGPAAPIGKYQTDHTIYKRRRAPRRVRARARRNFKQWRHNLLRQLPLQVTMFKQSYVISVASDAFQAFQGILLNSWYGSSVANDIQALFAQGNTLGTSSNAQLGSQSNQYDGRLILNKATMEVNISHVTPAGVPAFVDVYEVFCRRDCPQDVLNNAFQTNTAHYVTSAGAALANTIQGVTPFESPYFCRYWKIVRRRRIVLPPNDTVTMFLKSRKQMTINGNDLNLESAGTNGLICGRKGLTMGYLVIATQAAGGASTIQLDINANTIYRWKFIPGITTATYSSL